MDSQIFLSWFQEEFVPFVQAELRNLELEPKAIIFLDICSAHPSEELLVSPDGLAKFLPPNVTSLIQPMDQGLLESLKFFLLRVLTEGPFAFRQWCARH